MLLSCCAAYCRCQTVLELRQQVAGSNSTEALHDSSLQPSVQK
jgi:hypothetical protein